MLGGGVPVERGVAAFEQQNRLFPSHFTQSNGVFNFNQRQSIGGGERLHGRGDAMPVSVGLDHGPRLRALR